MTPLELWAGAECTVNRVGDVYFDQLRRTGSHGRLEDLERLKDLGVRALRFPVLWERVAPEPLAKPDFSWSDVRLERLRELGIRPIVGLLHHGSGPSYTSLCDPAFTEKLQTYARLVAERYPWVEDYTPVNEPLTTARFSCLYGHWYPHRRDTRSFLFSLLNQIQGTAAAMRAIRSVNPHARLVQTEDAGSTFSTAALRRQANYENLRRWLSFDLLFGKVDRWHPLREHLESEGLSAIALDELVDEPCAPAMLGMNHYLTSDRFLDERLECYPACSWGGNQEQKYADVEAVRVLSTGVRDQAAVLSEAWERYRTPLALTEVHLGCSREQQLRWFAQAWRGAKQSRERGVDVRAVTLWSVFGSIDWSSLVTRELGHYEVGAYDVRGPEPRKTALADLATELGRSGAARHPVLTGKGWWQESGRVLYHREGKPSVSSAAEESGPEPSPLLVIGDGPLASRLRASCERRGLAFQAVSPAAELSPNQIRDPWAVVLAITPLLGENLKALLARLRPWLSELPVLAFSSDLVFDGRTERPYVESDRARMSLDGRRWIAWEAQLSALVKRPLVIRSGPLLDPEGDRDALAYTLGQVERGALVRLPAEEQISPAYVPHLLDASLDLLIDGERGVWHLGSCSVCSPLQLARVAAERAALPTNRLVPGNAKLCGLSRGRYSRRALSSERGWPMPELDRALAEYVDRFRARPAPALDLSSKTLDRARQISSVPQFATRR
jgi:dTDP-4-dehydrorhamnose reductase